MDEHGAFIENLDRENFESPIRIDRWFGNEFIEKILAQISDESSLLLFTLILNKIWEATFESNFNLSTILPPPSPNIVKLTNEEGWKERIEGEKSRRKSSIKIRIRLEEIVGRRVRSR